MSTSPNPAPGAEAIAGLADRWSGDELAERLVEMEPALRRIFAWYRIPPQDAEDLLQEAVLLFVYKRRRIERPAAWLRGTVRKLCLRHCQRSGWPSTALPTDPVMLDELHGRVDSALASTGERVSVHRALAELRPKERLVVIACYVYGLSGEEAARIAGYAPVSGRQVRSRSLRKMRTSFHSREDRAEKELPRHREAAGEAGGRG